MLLSIQSLISLPNHISNNIDPNNPTPNQIAVPKPGHIAVPIVVVAHIIPLLI